MWQIAFANPALTLDSVNQESRNIEDLVPYQLPFEHIDAATSNLTLKFDDLVLLGNGGLDIVVSRSYSHTQIYENSSGVLLPSMPGHGLKVMGEAWDIEIPFLYNGGSDPALMLRHTASSGCQDKSEYFNTWRIQHYLMLSMLPDAPRKAKQLYRVANSGYSEITSDNWKAECIVSPAEGDSGRVVYSPDGKRYVFSKVIDTDACVNINQCLVIWALTKITDKNGNSIFYNYQGTQLKSISASDGRIVDFFYEQIAGKPHLVRIKSGAVTINYQYETYSVYGGYVKSRLVAVVRGDGSRWSMSYHPPTSAYDNLRKISAIVTPAGGVVNYVFTPLEEDNPGAAYLTSRTTAGTLPSSTWTFEISYNPSIPFTYKKIIKGNNYCQIWDINNLRQSDASANPWPSQYGASYSLWDYGLPFRRTVYRDSMCADALYSVEYSWDKRKISDHFNGTACENRGCFWGDNATYSPRLRSRKIALDGATHTTTYSGHDAYGNPATITETGPNGGARTTNLTYYIDTAKWIVNQVQNEVVVGGRNVTRTFDANGNLASVSRDGVIDRFTYDSQGNIATHAFPRNLVHAYSNYKRGVPQNEMQPEGVTIARMVDDAGNIVSETNGDGHTTTYEYDELNRVTRQIMPLGNPKSIVYTPNSKTATRGALVETTVFDGFGQSVSISLGGIVTTYQHDALGRTVFESNPGDVVGTRYEYDNLDRVSKVTNADGTFQTRAYGAGTTSMTDERGKTTIYSYRAYGDPKQQFLMGIAAPEASVSLILTRNSKDNVTAVTQGGLTRSYSYSSNGYLTGIVEPETGGTYYQRDSAGNMLTKRVGTSMTTNYRYDGQNRLVSVRDPKVAYPGSTISHTYNKTGKLLTSNSATGNRSYGYDANGNLLSETLLVDGHNLTTGYAYNGNDQLTAMTYPQSGSAVSYMPDVLGRPTQASGYVNNVAYWPSGQIKQIDYANGVVTQYGQNSRLWPSTFSTRKTGLAAYLDSGYTYDGIGNLTGISDIVDNNYNRAFGYDGINRLTSANGPWGTGSITYDGQGNITRQLLGGSSLYYTYDASNRMSSVSGRYAANFTYDIYGNITSGIGNTYQYDDLSRLLCANCNEPARKTSYTYDGANRRVSVTKAGVKSYEVFDSHNNQLIEFTPSQSNKLIEYIYLGGKRVAQRVSP